ncbi:MAG: hypothetical protein MRERC_3c111 [Mycoplasmataceae bacterium RC_NB112A]|nr:MAG: hypothetical protein MRERC_12c054 [Mycoplasmataceae bacterium RC_NB112A]KLL02258.1 MAG: hypothetical protein MRERC_3c111 [Mycoplasmataceae bacterium RC_NB112A]
MIIVVGISFFIPSELTYSLVNRKVKKEQRNLFQQEERIIKKIDSLQEKDFTSLPSSENPQKIALEKEIVELNKEIKKAYDPWWKWCEKKEGPEPANPVKNPETQKKIKLREEKHQEWVQKWSGESFSSPLFFQGKELGGELEKLKKKHSVSVINFENQNSVEAVQKEISKLVKEANLELEWYKIVTKGYTYVPLIWFKNIDKIKKNSELENWLASFLESKKKNDLWNYQGEKINLFKFILISNVNDFQPLSPKLKTKLNPFKPFLDECRLTIFLVSGVAEIVLLFILIKISRKNKNTTRNS